MKTDELIAMLSTGNAPVEPNAANRRFFMATGWGLFGATLLMALLLGVRADLMRAMLLPMFWVKLLVPATAALVSLLLAVRLAHPGRRLGRAPILLAALLLVAWTSTAANLLATPSAERIGLVLGYTWKTCTVAIAFLSVPLSIAAFWAMKGLAPTHPAWAGASVGLFAGAAAAAVYALHCPEMAVPFLGVWYVLGMLTPAAFGALLGPRLLRW